MIIVEGCDLVGKTTLAYSLVKELSTNSCGHFYGHLGNWPIESSRRDFRLHLAQLVQPYSVLDRFHLSEIVYGNFYRGNSRLTLHDAYLLDGLIRSKAGIVIVLTATEELLQFRHTCDRIVHSTAPLAPGKSRYEPSLQELLDLNKRFLDLARLKKPQLAHYHLEVTKTSATPRNLLEHKVIQVALRDYKHIMESYRETRRG